MAGYGLVFNAFCVHLVYERRTRKTIEANKDGKERPD